MVITVKVDREFIYFLLTGQKLHLNVEIQSKILYLMEIASGHPSFLMEVMPLSSYADVLIHFVQPSSCNGRQVCLLLLRETGFYFEMALVVGDT